MRSPAPLRHELAVTTNGKCAGDIVLLAQEAARAWGLPYVPRPDAPLSSLLASVAPALLVFSTDGVALWDREGSFSFHAGIAHLRIKRLDAGVLEDTLVRLAEFSPGESVLDCTLGLAQDALVAARAVGPQGRVVGLEKSLALFAVVSEGLKVHPPGPRSCRVEPLHADAADFLSAQPDGAFDCVLFDPMFGRPRKSQPSFEVLRRFADHTPLSPQVLAQARRVARRVVVVKGSRYSRDLKSLGLAPEPCLSRRSPLVWARVAGSGAAQSLPEPGGGPSLPSGDSFPDSAPACSCGIKSLGER